MNLLTHQAFSRTYRPELRSYELVAVPSRRRRRRSLRSLTCEITTCSAKAQSTTQASANEDPRLPKTTNPNAVAPVPHAMATRSSAMATSQSGALGSRLPNTTTRLATVSEVHAMTSARCPVKPVSHRGGHRVRRQTPKRYPKVRLDNHLFAARGWHARLALWTSQWLVRDRVGFRRVCRRAPGRGGGAGRSLIRA